MAQARERFQREFDQSKAAHQELFKSMENKVNEIAANHETQSQRSQKDLELKAQELAAKNAALEEELFLRQQSQEKSRLQQHYSFHKRRMVPLMLTQTKMWSK